MMTFPSNIQKLGIEALKEKAAQTAYFLIKTFNIDSSKVSEIVNKATYECYNENTDFQLRLLRAFKGLEMLNNSLEEEYKKRLIYFIFNFFAYKDEKGEIDEVENMTLMSYAQRLEITDFLEHLLQEYANNSEEESDDDLNNIEDLIGKGYFTIKPSTRVQLIIDIFENKYDQNIAVYTLKKNIAGPERRIRALTSESLKGGVTVNLHENIDETIEEIKLKTGLTIKVI